MQHEYRKRNMIEKERATKCANKFIVEIELFDVLQKNTLPGTPFSMQMRISEIEAIARQKMTQATELINKLRCFELAPFLV